MPIDLSAENGRTVYAPGDIVRVRVAWQFDKAPKRVDANLYWTTAGKGTSDLVIVATLTNDRGQFVDTWTADLKIPADAPPSYDGRLLSVRWAVEAVTDRRRDVSVCEIIVSPTGTPLTPPRLAK